MSKFWTLPFWLDVLERAAKTAAQVPLTAYGVSLLEPFDAFDLDWGSVGGLALGGFAVSVLTSIASAPIGGGTASALPAAVAPVPPPPTPPTPLPPP